MRCRGSNPRTARVHVQRYCTHDTYILCRRESSSAFFPSVSCNAVVRATASSSMVLDTEPVASLNGVVVVDVRPFTGVVAKALGRVGDARGAVGCVVLMVTGMARDGELSDGAAEANRLTLLRAAMRDGDVEASGFSGVLVSTALVL